MENISIQGKTNFFEKKVSEYQKMGVLSTEKDREIRFDAAFWIEYSLSLCLLVRYIY